MDKFKVGDIVSRKSYGGDILFRIADIKNNGKENLITLKGICYRIQADAPEADLTLSSAQNIDEHKTRMCSVVDKKCREIQVSEQRKSLKKAHSRSTPKDEAQKFSKPGKVLHIDGDNNYLETCLNQYKKFGIEAFGKYISEKDQPSFVFKLLQEYKPDILVLTGHDGVIKGDKSYLSLDNYRNSKNYIESVKEARRYDKDLDNLVIFAGACQSMYNDILKAGANFASSPYRVLIHALDPVFVCQKIAFASIDTILKPSDVINNTITGLEGIGGLETRGKYRNGFPSEPYY